MIMFSKILSLAEMSGFLNKVNLIKNNFTHLQIGPTGYLLRENLKTEWFHNTVMNKEITVFLDKLPFGIAEYKECTLPNDSIQFSDEVIDANINFNNFFKNEESLILKCSVFVSPVNATSTFHQWQRQRKMWWRKFSATPNRYLLTDVKISNDSQNIEIVADYPWGSQVVETLSLKTVDNSFTIPQLQFKERKRTVQAHIIVSETNLSTMFLNSICDAFDEPIYKEKLRQLFRFHRKLAPYKITFAVSGCDAATTSELNDLAFYLSKQLRTAHISTLLLPSKNSLEGQYEQYDQLGIPYTVVLNENTLKNGMTQLRSRDTTLKEQVHVSNLVSYAEQLFKHY